MAVRWGDHKLNNRRESACRCRISNSVKSPRRVRLKVRAAVRFRSQRPPGWGLPDASHGNVGLVSRPVVIECWPDRLVNARQRRQNGSQADPPDPAHGRRGRRIGLVGLAADEAMGSGRQGTLLGADAHVVRVAPDARRRFEELQTLLADSGLGIKESTHKSPIAGKPATPLRK